MSSCTTCVQVLQVVSVLTHAIAFGALKVYPQTADVAPLGLLAVPFAFSMNAFAAQNYETPRLVKPLKLYAIKWHTAVSLALFLAFFTAGVSVHGTESLVST